MERKKWNPLQKAVAFGLVALGIWIIYSGTSAPPAPSNQRASSRNTSGYLPIVPGETVEFVHPTLGCPTEKELDALETDAGYRDRVGFYKHFDANGCLSIPRTVKGLVINEDGTIDPWFRVRFASGYALWIDDLELGGPKKDKPYYMLWRWAPFRVGKMAITTTKWRGCASGLDYVPASHMAAWEKENCYSIPAGTRLKIVAVGKAKNLRDMGLFNYNAPVFAFRWKGKQLWMESDTFFDVARALTNH